MNVRYGKNKRKAISPVLATVILIAITLIAAIAIAGFVFGLFGSFTSSANVSAAVSSCSVGSYTCVFDLTNSGTASTTATSASITYDGTTVTLACTKATVTAGSTVAFDCNSGTVAGTPTAWTLAPTIGQALTGSISTTNGASVPYSGTWEA